MRQLHHGDTVQRTAQRAKRGVLGRYAGQPVLLRRDLDRIEPVPIPGTAGGSDVFFSPDGLSIGFETASELWTVPLEGGAPRR